MEGVEVTDYTSFNPVLPAHVCGLIFVKMEFWQKIKKMQFFKTGEKHEKPVCETECLMG